MACPTPCFSTSQLSRPQRRPLAVRGGESWLHKRLSCYPQEFANNFLIDSRSSCAPVGVVSQSANPRSARRDNVSFSSPYSLMVHDNTKGVSDETARGQ